MRLSEMGSRYKCFAHSLPNIEQRKPIASSFKPIIVEYETVAFHVPQVLFSFWTLTDFKS